MLLEPPVNFRCDLSPAIPTGAPVTAHQAAIDYTRRGWSVVPIPYQSKNPGFKGWEQVRLRESDIPDYFRGKPRNLGVLLGEPSAWLVDIDLDHPRCVELADLYLPATPSVFGRPGKPRSHRLYQVTSSVATKKHKSKSSGMLVELRSTGMQTVFPPSRHEGGELITWETEDAVPLLIDPTILLAAVEALSNAVKTELGERVAVKPLGSPKTKPRRSRIDACVAAMLRMQIADRNDGSGRLFAAACRAVEHDLSDGDAVIAIRDYAQKRPFPREWSDQQIADRLRDAEARTDRGVIRRPSNGSGKAKILIDPDEHRVVNETIDAIASDATIFQRGGVLVRVIREASSATSVQRCEGSATISFLPQPSLRERMTKYAEFTMLVKQKDCVTEVATHPTPWLVAAVDARGEWPGIRHLSGISDVPVLRADGTLWQTPGYDEQTGVLYEPSGVFPVVPEDVTLDDADAAMAELLDVVGDFRFEAPEHRSAWLAALLTPLARFAFEGPAPLFLIDANVRGAGKGLLAQTIGQIVLGREMPVSSYAHDPQEMRKKITAIALAGDRVIHLDNLEGNFGNDALDRALTATRWKDRILGKSQEVDLPLIPIWYGTGNNVAVAADTARRIIHIRLDVLEQNPEQRSDFKRPELLSWVCQNRGPLLSAAFTILRAYCNAGKPTQELTPFGSFEGWSRLVREAIVWLGLPDPCLTRVRLAESSDTTADTLGQLMGAWKEYDTLEQGIVISELINRLYAKEFPPRDAASVSMRAALEALTGVPPGKIPGARQVGARFKFYRRRVLDGFYIDTKPAEDKRGGALWRLCPCVV
jgi:hypothetical protein